MYTGEQLIERDEGGWLILDVPSCVCRHQLGDLRVIVIINIIIIISSSSSIMI